MIGTKDTANGIMLYVVIQTCCKHVNRAFPSAQSCWANTDTLMQTQSLNSHTMFICAFYNINKYNRATDWFLRAAHSCVDLRLLHCLFMERRRLQKVHLSAATVINKDARRAAFTQMKTSWEAARLFWPFMVFACDLFSMQYCSLDQQIRK